MPSGYEPRGGGRQGSDLPDMVSFSQLPGVKDLAAEGIQLDGFGRTRLGEAADQGHAHGPQHGVHAGGMQ